MSGPRYLGCFAECIGHSMIACIDNLLQIIIYSSKLKLTFPVFQIIFCVTTQIVAYKENTNDMVGPKVVMI